MKRPLSQAAFDTYVANPECAAYLASDILEKRLRQLLRLIADGEKFTVCAGCRLCVSPERSIQIRMGRSTRRRARSDNVSSGLTALQASASRRAKMRLGKAVV